jgi:carbonic anhydrase
MRLLEAIIQANHRALAGDTRAGLHPAEFQTSLPLVALTCIDARLNRLLPEVLGVPEDQFIWLRNAGNIIFDSHSSMTRTLALACAVKGGKEIAVIGHTDCRVRQTSVSQLIDSFRALGIHRTSLPDNLTEFFGLFASENQNVINGTRHIRQSPLISPQVPVHGLVVDTQTGRLEWLVNGYDQLGTAPSSVSPLLEKLEHVKEAIGAITDLRSSDLKMPEVKIGDFALDPRQLLAEMHTVKESVQDVLSHEKQRWLSEMHLVQDHIQSALTHSISVEPSPAPAPPPIQPKSAKLPIPIPPAIGIAKPVKRPKK